MNHTKVYIDTLQLLSNKIFEDDTRSLRLITPSQKNSKILKSIFLPMANVDITSNHMHKITNLIVNYDNYDKINTIIIILPSKDLQCEDTLYYSQYSYYETFDKNVIKIDQKVKRTLLNSNKPSNLFYQSHSKQTKKCFVIEELNSKLTNKLLDFVESEEEADFSLTLILSYLHLIFPSFSILPIWVSNKTNNENIKFIVNQLSSILNESTLIAIIGNLYHNIASTVTQVSKIIKKRELIVIEEMVNSKAFDTSFYFNKDYYFTDTYKIFANLCNKNESIDCVYNSNNIEYFEYDEDYVSYFTLII